MTSGGRGSAVTSFFSVADADARPSVVVVYRCIHCEYLFGGERKDTDIIGPIFLSVALP